MPNNKIENRSWFSKHKKGIIIASTVLGIAIGAAGLVIYLSPDETKRMLTIVKGQLYKSDHTTIQTSVPGSYAKLEVTESVTSKITEIVDSAAKRSYTSCDHPFPVNLHLRKLSEGRNPSPEKVLQGKEMGLDLIEMGCTIVDTYMKGAA